MTKLDDLHQRLEPLAIADEARLWLLYEQGAGTEGFFADLLGLDRMALRARYQDFVAREGSPAEGLKRRVLDYLDGKAE